MPFNSKDFSVGHAAISADGNTLVFASDMPGGKGGVDLYRVTRKNGTWSIPENLSSINTTGDEMFPFIHGSGALVFSSNGHPGFGGMDLFVAQFKNSQVGAFFNLGSPLNSDSDDFSFWLNNESSKGYFASNRIDGMGNDDLFEFSMTEPFRFGKVISGKAINENGNPVKDAVVELYDDKNNLVSKNKTKDDGSYTVETPGYGNFILKAVKDNYLEMEDNYKVDENSPKKILKDISMESNPGVALLFSLTDKNTKSIVDSVRITLINNNTGEEESMYSGRNGKAFKPIRENKIGETLDYTVRFEKPGFVPKETRYVRKLDELGVYNVFEELKTSFDKLEVGLEIAKSINLKPIYFDYRSSEIRPDAQVELDKIVAIMNQNPTMQIELGSHSDCRGPSKDNLELSMRRAQASAAYIKARITNPDRIYGIGYGESKLLNGCSCEGSYNPKYSEDQHKVNRRTEFIIKGL